MSYFVSCHGCCYVTMCVGLGILYRLNHTDQGTYVINVMFCIAVFVGPVVAYLFSVFGFYLPLRDTPKSLRWLHHISYFRAGFHVAVHSIYRFNRTKMHCSKEYCHYINPNKFLVEMDTADIDVGINMAIVLATKVLMHILTCTILWYRLNKR